MNANYEIKNFESNCDYNTQIIDFDGPLDLLLQLVKRARIEIKDIFVSEVTDQFLKYLDTMEFFDIEKASEYAGFASALLDENSKALLPRLEDDLEFEEEQGGIIPALEQLALFKRMSEKLKELENVNRYYKPPEPSANDYRIVYKDFNFEGLMKAFSDLLSRVELERNIHQKREIPKEVFTVPEKMEFIKGRISEMKECSFFELFRVTASKSEIITTFQAMLELLKRQFIKVEQKAVFDDITITLNENYGGDDNGDFGDLSEYN